MKIDQLAAVTQTIARFALPLLSCALFLPGQSSDFARDLKQPVDDAYTRRIAQYTTMPEFNSPLTNYLPASPSVPTPMKVLGDVAGAADMLPYAEDVHRYFRLLAASTPRVKVVTIGRSEEGREMIAVAIADAPLLAQAQQNNARLAQLADPRRLHFDDAKAEHLVNESFPVYYITGAIHSPETGAPTALMELAYRLAVDDSPYIRYIRSHMITLITPVVEVDGRDRMVDLYRWHKAHPEQNWPHLLYWGHYVAHDNNRDAMAMTLALTRNVLDTFLDWHAQVLHDLHESFPFLYDDTVGDGPYNSWIDPILTDEWSTIASENMARMQAFGMPGAYTHGSYDTWSPGYLMFLAGLHNGISRLYETFGNGGADTVRRILSPDQYSRTWYRPNPPYPSVMWSQRDNNNYEETALLATLSYFAHNTHTFLNNYYLKSKRSIQKPLQAGPAAYVLAADATTTNRQIELMKILLRQHVELQRLTEPAKVQLASQSNVQTFPAGSIVIRMDQPYARSADALLDRQFWAPEDPQKKASDDTGWSFGDLFNAKLTRVTNPSILTAAMSPLTDLAQMSTSETGAGPNYVVSNTAQVSLASFIYGLHGAGEVSVADEPFTCANSAFRAGSLLLSNVPPAVLKPLIAKWNLSAVSTGALPSVKSHRVQAPRVAMMHTWIDTQTEGWWRQAFDSLGVPFTYISTQTAAREADLRSKYDVIVFAPVGRSSTQEIVDGLPRWGNPMPWQKTPLTPNLGQPDATDDVRSGLEESGLTHLKQFIREGGLLITSEDTAEFAINEGLCPGVFVLPKGPLKVTGSVLNAAFVETKHPAAYGYDGALPLYSASGLAFNISNLTEWRTFPTTKDYKRPTGRGGPDDEDRPEGRQFEKTPPLPAPKAWEATALNEDQERNNPFVIPAKMRPRVILRFAATKDLLISGLLEHGEVLAEHAAVVDAQYGQGHVLLFANNPVYRGETIGSYALVFNAIMNFNHLR